MTRKREFGRGVISGDLVLIPLYCEQIDKQSPRMIKIWSVTEKETSVY